MTFPFTDANELPVEDPSRPFCGDPQHPAASHESSAPTSQRQSTKGSVTISSGTAEHLGSSCKSPSRAASIALHPSTGSFVTHAAATAEASSTGPRCGHAFKSGTLGAGSSCQKQHPPLAVNQHFQDETSPHHRASCLKQPPKANLLSVSSEMPGPSSNLALQQGSASSAKQLNTTKWPVGPQTAALASSDKEHVRKVQQADDKHGLGVQLHAASLLSSTADLAAAQGDMQPDSACWDGVLTLMTTLPSTGASSSGCIPAAPADAHSVHPSEASTGPLFKIPTTVWKNICQQRDRGTNPFELSLRCCGCIDSCMHPVVHPF
jgi:hypothetical protein